MSNMLKELREKQARCQRMLVGVDAAISELRTMIEKGDKDHSLETILLRQQKTRWNLEKELDRVTTAIFVLEGGE